MTAQFENIKSQITESLKNWWVLLLIGLLLAGTGFWTFTSPVKSYLTLAIIFSITFLLAGILESYFAISNRKAMDNWGWSLMFGIITALGGILMLVNPQISMVTMPFYIGFVILFRSTMAIGWATDLKRQGVLNWGNLMIAGVLGILFSLILIWNPAFGGMTIVFWTGFSFLMTGITSVVLAFKLRRVYKQVKG